MTEKSKRFINRELSWLEFNQRVLDEAQNEANPLLERLKFLAITASNLDEFFMVRVGSLNMMVEQGASGTDAAGLTPPEQMAAIRERCQQMVKDQQDELRDHEGRRSLPLCPMLVLVSLEPQIEHAEPDHLCGNQNLRFVA